MIMIVLWLLFGRYHVQGLRTLELCVDNLQPEFLYNHIQPVRAELMQVRLSSIILFHISNFMCYGMMDCSLSLSLPLFLRFSALDGRFMTPFSSTNFCRQPLSLTLHRTC